MENAISPDIKVNLLVKGSEWELVLNLLQVLKHKEMVDFDIENMPSEGPSPPEWTAQSLNEMLEKAENEENIPYEDFRSKYGL
ncbi:MAG: hypothetical protein R2830_23540 [Saprospiraceae bacterium]